MFDITFIVAVFVTLLVVTSIVYIFFIPLNWIKVRKNLIVYCDKMNSKIFSSTTKKLEDFEVNDKKSRTRRRKKFASEKIPPPFPNGEVSAKY